MKTRKLDGNDQGSAQKEGKNKTVRITNETVAAAKGSPMPDYSERNGMAPAEATDMAPDISKAADTGKTRVVKAPNASSAPAFQTGTDAAVPAVIQDYNPVTGWLVIMAGPGRGNQRKIGYGMHSIGRSKTQDIVLDFGDDSISRTNHARIEYDPETREFFIIKGDNLVYLNGKRAGAGGEMALTTGDTIKIGDTVMQFIAFCGPDFDWNASDG